MIKPNSFSLIMTLNVYKFATLEEHKAHFSGLFLFEGLPRAGKKQIFFYVYPMNGNLLGGWKSNFGSWQPNHVSIGFEIMSS